MHEHFKKVELFINITQEDYRRKSGVPYWKLILIQEEEEEFDYFRLRCLIFNPVPEISLLISAILLQSCAKICCFYKQIIELDHVQTTY